ncbi:MAG: type VI secretion system membrane subunit TssM [Pseudomonadota bacterium]|nr:type VI secretion system membrane subunit TssM [Pseudomonadota bacterium]
MFRKLSWLLNRTVLAVLGLLVVSILIWFAGDEIAFGQHRPLDAPEARLGLILLLFLVWGGLRLWRWWKTRQSNASLLRAVAQDTEQVPGPATATEEVNELRARFEKALETLKKSQATDQTTWFGSLFGRRYLYQMPWYVFIGAPGSGKTTALVNSGLNFPLADQFGKAAIKGVGGTRNCDWWFTNQAVLIDTAGRYTTQESNQALDKSEWEGFLGLLRKYRPRAPINGVILTVSVADLLSSDNEERERQAAAIRRRLSELYDALKVRFPVYVVVTKADLLGGFKEYFERLTSKDRSQTWGFTFELPEAGAAAPDLVRTFRTEYGALQKRLEDALPDLLQAEPDLARRALAYSFTQQFAGLKDVLERFVTVLFAESKFAQPPLVRGVYFTSGTQEGTPFDRVLGAIQRRFGVEARVQAASAAKGTGKSFFLTGLLQDLVFAEAQLVDHDPRRERRRRIGQATAIASMAVVLVGMSALWLLSYSNNRAYLDEIQPRVQVLAQDVQAVPNRPDEDIIALIPVLDEARALALNDRFDIDAPPWSYRMGLYEGDSVKVSADILYRRLLEELLLPRLAFRLKDLLRRAPQNDMGAMYSRLEAYLMLYDPAHQRGDVIMQTLAQEMSSGPQGNAAENGVQALSPHVERLFHDQVRVTRFARDDKLIEETRDRLAGYSALDRAYTRLMRDVPAVPMWTLTNRVSPQADQVFVRRSGASLSDGVPWAYTVDGYKVVVERLNKPSLLAQSDDGWVLNRITQTASGRASALLGQQLPMDLRTRYLNDYRDRWDRFLTDIALKRPRDIDEGIRMIETLSGPDGKLIKFISAVAKETTTLKKAGEDLAGPLSAVKQQATQKLQSASSTFGSLRNNMPSNSDRPGLLEAKYVDDYFREWERLADTTAQGRAQELNRALTQISEAMYNIRDANRTGSAPPSSPAAGQLQNLAAGLPEPLKGMLRTVAVSTTAQAVSAVQSKISAQLETDIAETCRKTIAGRYPFVRSASNEVGLRDFDAMFSPDGILQRFFDQNLANKVDRKAEPWTYRKDLDAALVGDSRTLLAFQKAARIREAFFTSGNRGSQFKIQIRPVEMDSAVTQVKLDVDGNALDWSSQGQAQFRPVLWPGPGSGSYVVLQTLPDNASIRKEGAWALHHLYDAAAHVTRGKAENRFSVEFAVGGHRLKFEVDAGAPNPLSLAEMKDFQCPTRL